MKNTKDYESYGVNHNGKKYGHTRIARENIKKHKKLKIVNKKRFAAVITTFSMIVYGGVSLVQDATKTTTKIVDRVEQIQQDYQQQKQKIAFTSLTPLEINSMSSEERMNLLKAYTDYLKENVLIQNEEYARTFGSLKDRADTSLEELQYIIGACSEEVIERQRSTIMDKYYRAIEIIDRLYPDKYFLNSVDDDVVLVNNVDYDNSFSVARR